MPKVISDRLPRALAELLDGRDLEAKAGETFELLTVGDDGWPNVALLSAGEVLARSEVELRLALWPGTATVANLRRRGRAVLTCVFEGTAYSVKLSAAALRLADAPLACFTCRVEAVQSDTVDYAELLSGIRFRLVDVPGAVERWRRTLDLLRRAE